MEEAWSQAEEELSQLGIKKSTCEEQLKTAEGMETRSRDELVETFYRIAEKFTELVIGNQELTDIVSLVTKYRGAKDLGEITQVLSRIRSRRESALWKENAINKAKKEELQSSYNQARQELDALKNQSEAVPLRREKVTKSRSILEAKGISCIPFYKALEFNPSLSSEEQALLEEQLLDAGLLDALIGSPKDYQRAKTELGSLSDSLILADADVCTGYDSWCQ